MPVLRRLQRSGRADRVARAFRHGLTVRPSLRFAVRELAADGRAASYPLSGAEGTVCLRHDGHDSWVLHEVYGKRAYEPPASVEALLAGRGRDPVRVVDLGAHVGLFDLFVLARYPRAEVKAFEPDPGNADLLARCIELNHLGDRWRLVRACAANHGGWVSFVGGRGERSHIAVGEEPGATRVPAIDVLDALGEVDLLKIDIEGGEWQLLCDERFARLRARAIVLEYHAFGCPYPSPRQAAAKLLRDRGYSVELAPEHPPEAAAGIAWAWLQAPDRVGPVAEPVTAGAAA